jgi:hypothetical protein
MTHAEMIAKIKFENAKNTPAQQATEKQISYFAKLCKLSKQTESLYRSWGACPYEVKINLMIELGRINKRGISEEINSHIETKQQAYINVMTGLYA